MWSILQIIQIIALVVPPSFSLSLNHIVNEEDVFCFTNVVSYNNHQDFSWRHFPVAVSTPLGKLFDERCQLNQTKNTGIPDCVVKNFHIRGIVCVKVILLDPVDHNSLSDAYWYLDKYWSRINAQVLVTVATVFNQFFNSNKPTTAFYLQARVDVVLTSTTTLPAQWVSTQDRSKIQPSYEYFYEQLPYTVVQVKSFKKSLTVKKYLVLNRSSKTLYPISEGKFDLDRNMVDEPHQTKIDDIVDRVLFRYVTVEVLTERQSMSFDQSIKELSDFLSRSFNSSKVAVANTTHFRGRLVFSSRLLVVRIKFGHIHLAGSNILMIPLLTTKFGVLTCAGLNQVVDAAEYFNPFGFTLWLTLLLSSVAFCLVFRIIFYYKKIYDCIELWVFACFLEISYSLSPLLSKSTPMRIVTGSILLMLIIITNGYKGVLITSLVKGFDERGIDSFEAGLSQNLTLDAVIPRNDLWRLRQYCCSPQAVARGGLDLSLFKDKGYEAVAGKTGWTAGNLSCRNAIKLDRMNPILLSVVDVRKSRGFTQGKTIGDTTAKFNLTTTMKERIYLRTINAFNPLPCGTNLSQELLKCTNLMVLTSGAELEDALFEAKYRKVEYKSLYQLPDETEILSSVIYGLSILVHTSQRHFYRTGRLYMESGVYLVLEQAKARKRFWGRVRLHRSKLLTVDETVQPTPLDFTTRIRITFIIFIGSIPFCILAFIGEMIRVKTKKPKAKPEVVAERQVIDVTSHQIPDKSKPQLPVIDNNEA